MYKLLFLFLLNSSNVFAQKKTYFLFAHAKKRTVQTCSEKELINSAEVSLTSDEAKDYRIKYLTQLRTKYNSANGYESVYAELVPPGKVIIYFEGKRTYEPRRDGWNCTSTFYHHVIASDFLSAENRIAKIKAEYKLTEFTNFTRWGKPQLESAKSDDLEVRWFTSKTAVMTFITNTRKDAALTVTIKSYKAAGTNLSLEGGFEKAKTVEIYTTVLQPGERLQKSFANADGFEIETAPAKIIKEEQGIIDNIKEQIRRYVTDPKGTITPSGAIGPRG